jgi:hypothetical protein
MESRSEAMRRQRVKIVALLLVSATAFSDVLVEKSFDEKVREASVVLIGTVERLPARNPYPEWAEVQVESVLKGTAPSTIRVRSHGMTAEDSFRMTVGCRYLFLLYTGKDMYVSVNGRHAVISVNCKPLVSQVRKS